METEISLKTFSLNFKEASKITSLFELTCKTLSENLWPCT